MPIFAENNYKIGENPELRQYLQPATRRFLKSWHSRVHALYWYHNNAAKKHKNHQNISYFLLKSTKCRKSDIGSIMPVFSAIPASRFSMFVGKFAKDI